MKPCQGLDTAPKIHPHNWQELARLLPVHAETQALNGARKVTASLPSEMGPILIYARVARVQVPTHTGSQQDQKPQLRTFKSGDTTTEEAPKHLS